MKLKETLTWILDNNKKTNGDEDYQFNIDFVHSLGLKCDCVGWSELDLGDLNADKILSAISSFCKENGYSVRGYYDRQYTDYTSDWYELIPTAFNDDTFCGGDEYITNDGKTTSILNIRAYREKKSSPKRFYDSIFVPERFRDACIRHNVDDIVFGWAKDKGRYEAEQYFKLFGNKQIPRVAVDCIDGEVDKKRMRLLGGYLPKLAEIFSDLTVNLQDCYIESDMPQCNVANAYYPPTFSSRGRNNFLIRKEFADLLIKEKAISERDLRPALVVDDFPAGYIINKTSIQLRPNDIGLKKSIIAYEKLKATERPSQNISEKEALKALRASKRERKEDFKKALPKAIAQDLEKTKYSPVLPYYLIANGGYLSDEFELLSYDAVIQETALFAKEIEAEELLKDPISGVVIAKCADGDRIILADSGKVVRYSHEAPFETEEWISLAQFVVDAINSI